MPHTEAEIVDEEVTVTGEFTLEGPTPNPEALESWLDFNSTFLLWPYARAHIASITAASQHLPLTLFTLQVPRPRAIDPETGEFEPVDLAEPASPADPPAG